MSVCSGWLRSAGGSDDLMPVQLIHAVDISPFKGASSQQMNTIAGASPLAMNGQHLLAYIDFNVGRHRLRHGWATRSILLESTAIGCTVACAPREPTAYLRGILSSPLQKSHVM
jgi:hypothetical protein